MYQSNIASLSAWLDPAFLLKLPRSGFPSQSASFREADLLASRFAKGHIEQSDLRGDKRSSLASCESDARQGYKSENS
jgi:hypothetical protein